MYNIIASRNYFIFVLRRIVVEHTSPKKVTEPSLLGIKVEKLPEEGN